MGSLVLAAKSEVGSVSQTMDDVCTFLKTFWKQFPLIPYRCSQNIKAIWIWLKNCMFQRPSQNPSLIAYCKLSKIGRPGPLWKHLGYFNHHLSCMPVVYVTYKVQMMLQIWIKVSFSPLLNWDFLSGLRVSISGEVWCLLDRSLNIWDVISMISHTCPWRNTLVAWLQKCSRIGLVKLQT